MRLSSALPVLLLLAFTLGCSRSCGSQDSPASKADPEPPPTIEVPDDGTEPSPEASRNKPAPPQAVPVDQCDPYCQKVCEQQLQIPCAESEGLYEAFKDQATCEDRCLDRCESGRASYLVEQCSKSADCYSYFECVAKAARSATGKTGDEAGKAGKGKGRKVRSRGGGGEPGPEPMDDELR